VDTLTTFETLVGCLAKLPGVGRRSAERMAMRLVLDGGGLLKALAGALNDVDRHLCCCSRCGSITAVSRDPCRLCEDPKRDGHVLCVVEDPADIPMIQQSGGFHGRYHALMGKISPTKGAGPGNVRIRSLLDRVEKEGFREIILAMSTDVEGDATASYIADLLKHTKVKVTRLAAGLPASSAILYSDPVTLAKAIKGRQEA